MSTIVLVGVTAVYAGITGKSVRLQSVAIGDLRRQEDAQQVRRLLDKIYPWQSDVNKVLWRFPVGRTDSPAEEIEALNYQVLNSVADGLRSISAQLPNPLAGQTMVVANLLAQAIMACGALENLVWKGKIEAIQLAAKAAKTDESVTRPAKDVEGTWDDARTSFYSDDEVRSQLKNARDVALVEWNDVRDGVFVEVAAKELAGLETSLRAWLLDKG